MLEQKARSWVEGGGEVSPVPVDQVPREETLRFSTGMEEVDRVLGGGFVPGSFLVVGGDPGIGKSTLLLQIAARVAREHPVLYVSGEESLEQIRMRAERLQALEPDLYLLAESDIRKIQDAALTLNPRLLVVDSIQTVLDPEVASAPGSVNQVRECGTAMLRMAKEHGITVVAVGHVTKEGSLAGPRTLEHMVDGVFYLEGESLLGLRILRSVKNRFGSTNELGVLEMTGTGLREVKDASALFVDTSLDSVPGRAIAAPLEGKRALLVEVQALLAYSPFPVPQRTVTGFDARRLSMLLAILDQHLDTEIRQRDVFLQVLGGFRLTDTAGDLAVVTAILSAYEKRPPVPGLVAIGEVDLSGGVRRVPALEVRLQEAARMGFRVALVPEKPSRRIRNLKVKVVRHLGELRDHALG